MGTSALTIRAETWRSAVMLAVALVIAFMLGGAGGYALRAQVVADLAPTHVLPLAAPAPCPSGSRPVVWYSARTWSCVPSGAQG